MLPADGEGLRPQADVAIAAQRLRGVFQRLPERRAAVSPFTQERPNVQMGVEVDDGDLAAGVDVAEVMSVSRLMAAAQHDRHGPGRHKRRDHFRQRLLTLLQIAGNAHVPHIEQTKGGQVDAVVRVPGREAIQPVANGGGSGGGAWPALVAAHTLILRKSDEDRTTGPQPRRPLPPKLDALAQTRIVRSTRPVGGLRGFKPGEPRARA